MVNGIIEFKNENGKMPEMAKIRDKEIPRENYSRMIERVNKFLLENGRNPGSIEIK